MRVAIGGSHNTGKSTLIAAFAAHRPQYVCEPEAFELLGDDVALLPAEGPDLDGLAMLLGYTVSVLATHQPGAAVIFERSPVDYLAYAAASQSITASERDDFIHTHIPTVRDAIRDLEMIAMLPVSSQGPITSRSDESERFRCRVDNELRRALIDDDYGLFESPDAPLVLELSPLPDQQLAELLRCTETPGD